MSFLPLPHPGSSPADDSTPPPPADDSTLSPPPPTDDGSTPSPPPPTDDGSTQSSPPPPTDDGSTQSSPPPPTDNGSTPSPPPPSPSNNSTQSPPPPNSDNSGSTATSPNRSPAPPPPKKISDGKHKSKSKNSDNDSVVTGVAASVALLIFIALLFVCCSRRRARKRKARARAESMKYHHMNNNNINNNYYRAQNWQQNDAGGSSKRNNWQMAPPPPPPPMMMTSGSFSGPPLPPPHPMMALGGYNKSTFSYDDLAAATGGFAQENLLGQGGFGYVHKGVLPNGKVIAVKSLKANSGQGEREFQAEVDIISRVHHRHLVSLVGYCIAGNQRMLVYEFVPNGNLEQHLHGSDGSSMDWPTRLKIALGAAKGFAYLHEDCHPRIIHRDIKAANILVDENFDAKVADFGLAKLSSDTFTHVSTRIMGTFGYLAPEYASTGKLTEKSDCYSYGIMLLELITGRRPIDMNSDDEGLVDWARPILVRAAEGGSFEEMVDPRLGNNYDRQEMLRAMLSAAACIRHSARRRPKMSQIVRALEGDVSLDDLSDGKTPHSAMFGSSGSESDLKGFGRIASSQDFSVSLSTSEDGSSQDMRANKN